MLHSLMYLFGNTYHALLYPHSAPNPTRSALGRSFDQEGRNHQHSDPFSVTPAPHAGTLAAGVGNDKSLTLDEYQAVSGDVTGMPRHESLCVLTSEKSSISCCIHMIDNSVTGPKFITEITQ